MSAPAARGRVTLTDIAQACELSRATVSLVLRGSPLVNADTRARVVWSVDQAGCAALFRRASFGAIFARSGAVQSIRV